MRGMLGTERSAPALCIESSICADTVITAHTHTHTHIHTQTGTHSHTHATYVHRSRWNSV